MRLIGVDFTSAPRKSKPITAAFGVLDHNDVLTLQDLACLPDWSSFEALLTRPGPWLGGFDFPFGLPREAVTDLGWPDHWPALVHHCRQMGRTAFRAALDHHREQRPFGQRYAHRQTDRPAGSHSPLKLVNPPVGLMFLEGAPRLLDADVTVPLMHEGDPRRVAVEAYPGMLARGIVRAPYKSDQRGRQSEAHRAARSRMLDALAAGTHPLGTRVKLEPQQRTLLEEDASGDRLDAVLALVQAGWCSTRGAPCYGLPADTDPLEGWIASAVADPATRPVSRSR